MEKSGKNLLHELMNEYLNNATSEYCNALLKILKVSGSQVCSTTLAEPEVEGFPHAIINTSVRRIQPNGKFVLLDINDSSGMPDLICEPNGRVMIIDGSKAAHQVADLYDEALIFQYNEKK